MDLFARLDEAEQAAIVGPAQPAAFRDRAIKPEDLVGRGTGAHWGTMCFVKGLSDMLGEKESAKYRHPARREAAVKATARRATAGGSGGGGKPGRPTRTSGGGGGDNEEKARREYERERNRLLYSWVRGSTRKTSVEMQEAVKQEFELDGEVLHGTFAYRLSQSAINRLRAVVRKMYNETQADLADKGTTEMHLRRGVAHPGIVKRVLTSWTSSDIVAERFGSYTVLEEIVPASRVLAYHQGPGWQKGPFGEQEEYLVLGI